MSEATPLDGEGSAERESLIVALRLLGFALLCFGPRLAGIAANVVFHDDYFFGSASEDLLIRPVAGFFVPDFRLLQGALVWLFTVSSPEFFWLAPVPKIVAGLFAVGFAESAFRCLRAWGWGSFSALLAPALFVSHVAVNEILLWNTTHAFPLWFWLVLLGFRLTGPEGPTNARRFWGGLALATVLFAYEFYLVGFLVWALLEGCVKVIDARPGIWRTARNRGTVFAILVLIYAGAVVAMASLGASGRSFVAPTSLGEFVDQKVHGMANLIVNIWMPPIAFWTSVETAWSAWKWALGGSVAIALVAGMASRRSLKATAVLVGFMILAPGLAVLPTWLSKQSPESWRVSLPALLATCLGLGLVSDIALREGRNGGMLRKVVAACTAGMMLGALALSLPATAYETRLRVAANKLDREALEEIRSYWSQKGLGPKEYSVGRISTRVHGDVWRPRGRQLTAAYEPYRLQSAFRWEFSWRGLVRLHGMAVVELQEVSSAGFEGILERECVMHPESCRFDLGEALAARLSAPGALARAARPLVVIHDDVNRVSAVGVPLVP